MKRKKRSFSRVLKGGILRWLMYLCAFIVCALLVFIIGYICVRGIPNLSWELVSTETSYLAGTIGILPNILNTLYIILTSMVIVVPVGVCAAIYLTEYATNQRVVRVIRFAVDTLTGIPSIIFGLVGMLVFVQLLGTREGVLAGSLTLVIMVLPTIISNTQESLKSVPQSYRDGALALGSGKWHMIRTVVLPNSLDGIVTGCILAIGRITGESAALLLTAGIGLELNSYFSALSSSSATLTVALYLYAGERGEFDVAFAIAVILMALTLVLNLAAKAAGRLLKRKDA
ncbi:MAG: phosphate ABC transporter permease PstA [Oscillospiraceae bacterium]|nr:phosphate ABC transporter permease PstA [Oscillospiraceae bacterium]